MSTTLDASTTRATGTVRGRAPVSALPAWPFTVLMGGLPVWWAVGLLDVVLIPFAVVMLALLLRCHDVRAPRHFGVWLLFVLWSAASVVMIEGGGDLIAFGYRLSLYVGATVLFLYLYNARPALTARRVCGVLTVWWVVTVVGGYLGLLFADTVVHTPLSAVLPQSLQNNTLVDHMVVRRLTQYNPESYLQVAPRPSAPFLYTNNWGNVYSLLLPFVVAHLAQVRRERRFWALLALLPISTVPALLTLNRGMFLGIGVAVAYVALRAALAGRWSVVAGLAAAVVVAVSVFNVLPVQERQDDRLSARAENTSTDTRARLYTEALALVPESPVLGHGGPQDGLDPDAVPVGTQGQVWMVLVSHGPVAAACFVGWFLLALAGCVRRRDPVGLACSTTLLVGTLELLYYGVLPYGLPLMMAAAALGLRGADPILPATSGPQQAPSRG